MSTIKFYACEVSYLGPWAFEETTREDLKEWLNCGDFGGYALGALRMGIKKILFQASSPVYEKIVAIASHYQAQVLPLSEEA